MFRGHEAHGRSLAKAVTWRVSASLDTFVISLVFTGNDRSGINSSDRTRYEDCPLLFPRADLGSHCMGASSKALVGPLRLTQ